MSDTQEEIVMVRGVKCRACNAKPGESCEYTGGEDIGKPMTSHHSQRWMDGRQAKKQERK